MEPTESLILELRSGGALYLLSRSLWMLTSEEVGVSSWGMGSSIAWLRLSLDKLIFFTSAWSNEKTLGRGDDVTCVCVCVYVCVCVCTCVCACVYMCVCV